MKGSKAFNFLRPSASSSSAARRCATAVASAAIAATSELAATPTTLDLPLPGDALLASASSSSSSSPSPPTAGVPGTKGVSGGRSSGGAEASSSPAAGDMSSSSSSEATRACQFPLSSKATSLSSALASIKTRAKSESMKRSSGVAKARSQTGQHLHLFTKYASKSKHCKCLHGLPRAGVLILSMEIGQMRQTRPGLASSSQSEAKASATPFLHSSSDRTATCLIVRFASNFSLIPSCRLAFSELLSPPAPAADLSWRRAASFSRIASRRVFGSRASRTRFLTSPSAGSNCRFLASAAGPFVTPPASAATAGTLGFGNSSLEAFLICSNAQSTFFASCFRSLPT
mmetsp:Transcript_23688/g.63283  ORF Transcript_23688/g.63283 Transcript_23688/m.63283 type:complete len:344 (-) Transcript_23688:164-1195(-)